MNASETLWHDVENGGYGEDLEIWRALAAGEPGPILDLGCGTGRVALDLARRGHAVCAVDRDARLLEALRFRAWERELEIDAVEADLPPLDLGERRFGLILAPMQLLQLLRGSDDRVELMRSVREALVPGGLFAAAIVEGTPSETWEAGQEAPLPDVRERAGWVYSSLPVSVRSENGRIVIERLRQAVSPAGEMAEESDRVELSLLAASTLETEAAAAGLAAAGRTEIGETDRYASAVVVLLRAKRAD